MTLETLGMDYSFFVEQAVKLHQAHIEQEYLDEMQGMADGFTAGGFPTTLGDIIGWNAWCFASMSFQQAHQYFSAVWADGFPRSRHHAVSDVR